jgi:hypothetical protein
MAQAPSRGENKGLQEILAYFPAEYRLTETQKYRLYLLVRLYEEGYGMAQFQRFDKIFACESGWRHYDSKGNVLSGYVHPPDKGVAQINTKANKEEIKASGLDVMDPYGNLDFAIVKYKTHGYKPWVCKS